jgi:hypothetical protein
METSVDPAAQSADEMGYRLIDAAQRLAGRLRGG